MKLRLVLFVALLTLGAWLGQSMMKGSGYVLLSYGSWVVETSIWVGLILILSLAVVSYLAIHLLVAALQAEDRLRQWRAERGAHKAMRKTVQGLLSLAEGNWKRAQRLLVSGAHGETRLINYIAAARAAQQNGDYDRCDELLAEAANTTKGAELAVSLQQAQLQLERHQYEQCLATCLRIRKQFPKHQYANKMLLKAYMALEDWQAVVDLLPQLIKHRLILGKAAAQLELKAYSALIEHIVKGRSAQSKDAAAIMKIWRQVPKAVMEHKDFISVADGFVRYLIKLDAQKQAESLLRHLLTQNWRSDWVRLYGWVKGQDEQKQLLFAEDQLQERPNDAALLLTLGRLSLRNELWAKAMDYLQASLGIKEDAETRAELGRLYLAQGDHAKALDMLKQGAALQPLPDLPLPQAEVS